jgi:hypothetical protein
LHRFDALSAHTVRISSIIAHAPPSRLAPSLPQPTVTLPTGGGYFEA